MHFPVSSLAITVSTSDRTLKRKLNEKWFSSIFVLLVLNVVKWTISLLLLLSVSEHSMLQSCSRAAQNGMKEQKEKKKMNENKVKLDDEKLLYAPLHFNKINPSFSIES